MPAWRLLDQSTFYLEIWFKILDSLFLPKKTLTIALKAGG